MPRPRLVEDPELLDAAMFAFWAGGYGGVSTRALEEATGLPASSLYHRFGSKEGLFVAALEHYLERVVGGRIARYLGDGDPVSGLRDFFTSVYRADRRRYHACLLANTWAEPVRVQPAIAAVLERGNRQLHEAFRQNVERAKAAGLTRRDLHPALAASYLVSSLQGLLATARGENDFDRLDAIVDLILRAIVAASEKSS